MSGQALAEGAWTPSGQTCQHLKSLSAYSSRSHSTGQFAASLPYPSLHTCSWASSEGPAVRQPEDLGEAA